MGKDNRGYVAAGCMQNNGCCENWNTADKAAETASGSCGCGDQYAAPASCCANEHTAYNGHRGRQHKYQCGCPDEGTHVFFETCDGQQEICVTGICEDQQSMGRILDVTTTLQNVCPGRRSAVGLTLTEVDNDGTEYARGFRAITVPAHNGNCNRDVQLDSVRFILPEDLSLQRRRHFICRVNHHYMDADNIWG